MAFLEEYTLLDELGQGGYATVYKVRHNELGYIRAVRVMNVVIARGEEDKTYQRFLEECRLLLRIGNGNHPNIIHICRPLLKDQRAAVEMDFVDGVNLLKYNKKCGGFVPVEDVIRLLKDIGSALAYCHEDIYRFCMDRVEDNLQDDPDDGSKVLIDDQTRARLIQKYRVIHNDIHSDNIIRREDGSYVLLDFGLAIQGESVVRSSRRSDGAPEFKAPEKWDGNVELTTQSDIYSFGVVLYEYLTGRTPFPLAPEDAGSAKALYLLGEAHKSQKPDSIFELRKSAFEKANPGQTYDAPDYPQWLEEVIMKCLEKNPEDRFGSGKELYEYVKMQSSSSMPAVVPDVEPEVVPEVVELSPAPVVADNSKKKPWMIAAIVLAVLLTAVSVVAALMISSGMSDVASRDKQIAQMTDSLQVADEQIAVLTEAAKPVLPLDVEHYAIEYMDSNERWSKTAMDEIPELYGLWDAMNTYDYDGVASYFRLLQLSDNYMALLKAMRDNLESVRENYDEGRIYGSETELTFPTYLFRLRPTLSFFW